MSYREHNGIGSSSRRGWNSDTFVKRNETTMNADELDPPIIARLESEILTLKDEVENQTNRAEAAEAELREIKAQFDFEAAQHEKDMEEWHQRILAEEAAPAESSELSKQVAAFMLGDGQ